MIGKRGPEIQVGFVVVSYKFGTLLLLAVTVYIYI